MLAELIFFVNLVVLDTRSGYIKLENKFCKTTEGSFPDFATAINECNEDEGCGAVNDALCNNRAPFKLCSTSYIALDSTSKSCIYAKSALRFCDRSKATLDKVTQKICPSSGNGICEAYVKTGYIDGFYVDTCNKYCDYFGLRCLAGYEDENGCEKDKPGAIECNVEFTGTFEGDLICRCGKVESTPSTNDPSIEVETSTTLEEITTVPRDTTTRYDASKNSTITQRIVGVFREAYGGDTKSIVILAGIGSVMAMVVVLIIVICVRKSRPPADAETVRHQVDLETNENGINNETTSLKPEIASRETELTPGKVEGTTSNKEEKPLFDVNEATTDASIVTSSENPYYEGM